MSSTHQPQENPIDAPDHAKRSNWQEVAERVEADRKLQDLPLESNVSAVPGLFIGWAVNPATGHKVPVCGSPGGCAPCNFDPERPWLVIGDLCQNSFVRLMDLRDGDKSPLVLFQPGVAVPVGSDDLQEWLRLHDLMAEPVNPCKCVDCGGTEPGHSADCSYMLEMTRDQWDPAVSENLEGPGPTDEERRQNAQALQKLTTQERFALMFRGPVQSQPDFDPELLRTLVLPDSVLVRAKEFAAVVMTHMLEATEYRDVRADNAAKARAALHSPERVAGCLEALERMLRESGGKVAWSKAARSPGITAGLLEIVVEQFPHRFRMVVDRQERFAREQKQVMDASGFLRDPDEVMQELAEAESELEQLKASGADLEEFREGCKPAWSKIRQIATHFSSPGRLAIHGVPADRLDSALLRKVPLIAALWKEDCLLRTWTKAPAASDSEFDPRIDVGLGMPVLWVRRDSRGADACNWRIVGMKEWAEEHRSEGVGSFSAEYGDS